MKKIPIFLFILIITAGPAFCGDVRTALIDIGPVSTPKKEVFNLRPGPITLSDCYKLALRQSEVIAISADSIRQAQARFLQAISVVMPYISFQSTDIQEAMPSDAGTTFGTLKPTKFSERQFYITQTLFSGFKAIAAVSGSTMEKDQRVAEKIRAEQLLLVDVSNAFYLFIEKKEDLRALLRIKAALTNRIEELKLREDLGRSRPSEVVNARAQLYTLEADLKVIKSQEIVARQLLEFLIGRPVDNVSDSYKIPDYLMDEGYYLSRFMNRPDIKAANYAWQYSEKQLDVINSDFLPTVSWQGNFYTQRTAFDKGTDWDIMLKVDVPIFEGTETLAKSQEYKLTAHQKELEYIRLKRLAPYDIKDAYVKLDTALAVHENLRKAFYTAKMNYYLQRKDYDRNLVSNLDVLAAIQTLQDAQRNYIRAVYEAKRLYWRLRVSVGESIEEALNDTV